MHFSDDFRRNWWGVLLALVTLFGIYRMGGGVFTVFDQYLLVIWFVLVIFPIISEISIFGFSIKKELESAKNELKSSIAEIKSHIQMSSVININPTSTEAKEGEYRKKIKNEVLETEVPPKDPVVPNRSKVFTLSDGDKKEGKTSRNVEVNKRLEKTLAIEDLLIDRLRKRYADRFKPKQKLEDEARERKIIVTGILQDQQTEKIEELIEVRYVTAKSFDNVFYILSNFLKKLQRLGLQVPVRFVLVSEEMTEESAQHIEKQIVQLKYLKKFNRTVPDVKAEYFKLLENEVEAIDVY